MATTTNYGWTTPDDTDLVKDGAAAIRTLGSSVDTTTKALNPETTTGDIAYRSATADTNTRLALGTAGQVLTVNSGATAPEWATPAGGGGKVLQVLQNELVGQVSSSSSAFADTGLTVTITPSAATSKILVLVSLNGVGKRDNNTAVGTQLLRGATVISRGADDAAFTNDSSINVTALGMTFLDSPATTSATTYKVQFNSMNNNASARINMYENANNSVSTITVMEIGA
jgi:hypothetical protein